MVETAATLVVCGAAVTRSRSLLLGDKGRLYRRCRCCGHCGSSRKRKGEDRRRPRGAGERHHHGYQRELQRNDKGGYVVRQVLHRLVQTLPAATAHVGRAGDRAQGKGKRGPSQLRQRLLAVPTVSRGRVPDPGARAQPKDSRIQEISRERSAGGVCPQRLQEAGGRLGAQVALRTVGKLQGPGREGGVARQKFRGIDNREGNTNVDGLPLCGGGARGGDRSCRDCARQRQATKGGLKNPLPLCVGGKIRRWPGPNSIDVVSYLAVFVVLKERFAFGGGRKRLREAGDNGVSKGGMRTWTGAVLFRTQAFLVIYKHSKQTGDAFLRAWLLLLAGVKYNDMCIERGFSPSNIYVLFFSVPCVCCISSMFPKSFITANAPDDLLVTSPRGRRLAAPVTKRR